MAWVLVTTSTSSWTITGIPPAESILYAGMPLGLLMYITYATDELSGAWAGVSTSTSIWSPV